MFGNDKCLSPTEGKQDHEFESKYRNWFQFLRRNKETEVLNCKENKRAKKFFFKNSN